jgi:hypothetical protein
MKQVFSGWKSCRLITFSSGTTAWLSEHAWRAGKYLQIPSVAGISQSMKGLQAVIPAGAVHAASCSRDR